MPAIEPDADGLYWPERRLGFLISTTERSVSAALSAHGVCLLEIMDGFIYGEIFCCGRERKVEYALPQFAHLNLPPLVTPLGDRLFRLNLSLGSTTIDTLLGLPVSTPRCRMHVQQVNLQNGPSVLIGGPSPEQLWQHMNGPQIVRVSPDWPAQFWSARRPFRVHIKFLLAPSYSEFVVPAWAPVCVLESLISQKTRTPQSRFVLLNPRTNRKLRSDQQLGQQGILDGDRLTVLPRSRDIDPHRGMLSDDGLGSLWSSWCLRELCRRAGLPFTAASLVREFASEAHHPAPLRGIESLLRAAPSMQHTLPSVLSRAELENYEELKRKPWCGQLAW
eukprot:TRINITY_DN124571_c0_g1_i1.p1 TRINITY_DN124571_c0_g1~~TRINITY_DN124571_c0_g1_i1.p1  ORF type:complete len:334 (+),score=26.13 TRINITY_DN124571_c0_g1_i1:74-1075(+)